MYTIFILLLGIFIGAFLFNKGFREAIVNFVGRLRFRERQLPRLKEEEPPETRRFQNSLTPRNNKAQGPVFKQTGQGQRHKRRYK